MRSLIPKTAFWINFTTSCIILLISIVITVLLEEAECGSTCFKPKFKNESLVEFYPSRHFTKPIYIAAVVTTIDSLLILFGLVSFCFDTKFWKSFRETSKISKWLVLNSISGFLFLIIGICLQNNYVKYHETVNIRTLAYSKTVALSYCAFIVVSGIASWMGFIFVFDWYQGKKFELHGFDKNEKKMMKKGMRKNALDKNFIPRRKSSSVTPARLTRKLISSCSELDVGTIRSNSYIISEPKLDDSKNVITKNSDQKTPTLPSTSSFKSFKSFLKSTTSKNSLKSLPKTFTNLSLHNSIIECSEDNAPSDQSTERYEMLVRLRNWVIDEVIE